MPSRIRLSGSAIISTYFNPILHAAGELMGNMTSFLVDKDVEGYGVQCCFRTTVDTYKEGIVRGDAASKHRLGNRRFAACRRFIQNENRITSAT